MLIRGLAGALAAQVSLATCTWDHNRCRTDGLFGGCEGKSADSVRIGLPNPFCQATGGRGPFEDFIPHLACDLEESLRTVWEDIKADAQASSVVGPRDLYGAVVRLAFHDALELDVTASDSFGSDGCLSANTRRHDGLWETTEEVALLLEPRWQQTCRRISRADFWVYMANFALIDTDTTGFFRDNLTFKTGRKDVCNCDVIDASRFYENKGAGREELDRIFVKQMGLNPHDSTILLGAHTIGSMNPRHSGFGLPSRSDTGTPWVPTPTKFDNEYFSAIFNKAWEPVDISHGDSAKAGTWNRFVDNRSGNERSKLNEAMLNVDMVLAFDLEIQSNGVVARKSIKPTNWCGKLGRDPSRSCYNSERMGCCTESKAPGAADLVLELANNNNHFLQTFAESWGRMVDATNIAKNSESDLTSCEAVTRETSRLAAIRPDRIAGITRGA